MQFECTVDLSDMEEKLSTFEAKVCAPIFARALRAGGDILAAKEREMAPQLDKKMPGSDCLEPGALKDDIQVRIDIDGSEHRAVAHVGPSPLTAYVANWLEHGHEIAAHGAYYVNWKGLKKHHKHGELLGFVEPHPFIRQAFNESSQEAVDRAAEVLVDGVNQQMGA